MPQTPETSLKSTNRSRSLGIALGVTEVIYLLGIVSLATGVSLVAGIPWALILVGLFLLRTAEHNAKERG